MKTRFIVSVLGVLTFFLPVSVCAQPESWITEKYSTFIELLLEHNDYDGAKKELVMLSEQGDPQASCCLAVMLCFGEQGDRDYYTALELLLKSAETGYERAEYLLGGFGSMERSRQFWRLIVGDDSMQDEADTSFWQQCFKVTNSDVTTFQDAFMWFLVDDDVWGYQDIMYYSAVQYLNGSYGVVDVAKAIKWLKRSSALGSEDAIELLAAIKEMLFNVKEPDNTSGE